ncbi:MAG: hypothetical protein WKF30_11380 [Pyrinomonadaceae bacterium]
MKSSSAELIFVLVLMAFLTVFAFTAVFIFLKVMRQERRAKEALREEKRRGSET